MEENNELKHSGIYLGMDFSDGIKHWKYIKKYRTASGNWRYIYKSELQDKVTKDTPYSPEELDKRGEKDEWIETESYTTSLGNKRYRYISADGSKTSDVPEEYRKKTEKASWNKELIAKGKNFLYRLFR